MLLHLMTIAILSSGGVGWSAQDPGPTSLPEIVVDGRSTEAKARDFISEVSAPSQGARLGRWRSSICVGAVNLGAEAGRYLVDRVSAAASEVGLTPGEPGCSANVVIVATSDGDKVAKDLVARHRRVLFPGVGGFTRSRAALQRFATSDNPVRWWHVSQPSNPETGGRIARIPGLDSRSDPPANATGEPFFNAPRLRVQPTLLSATTRQDITRVFIVVDFTRIGATNFEQLADYVAFIALAQVDSEADTKNFDTILNVFDDPGSTPRLTEWDRSFLLGLYESDDAGVSPAARAAAVRREMIDAIGNASNVMGE